MDRNTIVRWILIAGLFYLGYHYFLEKKSTDGGQQVTGEAYIDAPGFAPDVLDVEPGKAVPSTPPQGEACTIHGNRFETDLSSRGAGITHYRLTDARYAQSAAADMSTTPDHERWRNLRTLFRRAGTPASPDDQVKYDRFDWKLEAPPGPESCQFSYADDRVKIVKTIHAGERPFELDVETTLTNLADAPKRHATSIEAFAYRTNAEVKGKLGRVSPFQTNLECARADQVERKGKDDKVFKSPPFWYEQPLINRYAAISNYYFAQALVPADAAGGDAEKPSCAVLAEQWYGGDQKPDDDTAGDIYHARLEYPARTLMPHESATYKQIAFFGPKERDVLAKAAGGQARLQDLINLGTFSIIAKILVTIITWIHANMAFGNWGIAIIILTLGLKICLFPLTWKQIQSTVAMRRLKPEIDALNAKFKDDAQAKNLAMMELWRKNKVNPLGGCLPALVQMPIWFALYATLQTAVEFYHSKFLWFTDLSAPDKLFILPIVLGAAMILQQRIVPQQGMDPMQAKLMSFLMPGVFTVMMLFLPAALGVYMLTNSVLGITQQLAVEKLFPRAGAPATASAEIVVKSDNKKGTRS
ncbi:MAG TPA: membrane protein insertase YidC [Polyangiaceae bacterium]|jgi:YidC/Oxa1 family membrane protein insertase|nr:membrane protein insertase YidC [Polyangiaceae bacterium]